MAVPVFVIYPEIYAILSEHRRDDRLDAEGRRRIVQITSAWEAAIEEQGDRVAKVEVYFEKEQLTFQAFETSGWTEMPELDDE